MIFNTSKSKQIANNLAIYSVSTTIAQVFMMVYVVLLARILGPTELGYINSAYALAGLTAFALNLGMDTWLLRKAGLVSDVTILSGQVIKIKTEIGIIWSLALVLLAPIIRPDIYTVPMMILISLDTWSEVCFTTEIQALNVQRRMKTITLLVIISRGGRLLGLGFLYLFGVQAAIYYAFARAIATIIGLSAATYLHRPQLFAKSKISIREVLSDSFPYGISEFLALIYTNADVTILALMAGATAVGYYSPASSLIHALYVVPNAVVTVMIPVMTRLGAKSLNRFRESLKILFITFLSLGVLLWAVIGMGAKWFVPLLLGSKYQLSSEILVILSPILLLKCIDFFCVIVLVAVGWQRKRLFTQFVASVFTIIANIIFIPINGVIAVSWIYVFGEVIITIGYLWITFRWIKNGSFDTIGIQTEEEMMI